MTIELKSCLQAWGEMTRITAEHSVRNYVQRLDMSDYCVETPLFPKAVLEAYSAWNLEDDVTEAQQALFSPERGGGQGDYRQGMKAKIANVVNCLAEFPDSKRAVITISNDPFAIHKNDEGAKCLREIHLHLDDHGKLSATVLFRAQAAVIFPKNIHFIGSVMQRVANALPGTPTLGEVFYLATILASTREV